MLILNLVTAFSSLYFVGFFGDGSSSGTIQVLMAGLLILQLIFLSLGALVAGLARKPKAAPSRATSVMFLTFLLYYLVNLDENLSFLRFLTPFKYFDAATLLADGALDPVFVALSAVIIVLAVAGTYRFFAARDLTV